MLKIEPFETHAEEYDAWYETYPYVFQSEAEALREALPIGDIQGIEVGIGTGRFAQALGIKEGIEPARAMREMAKERGIEVIDAVAEELPYKDLRFDFVLMAACINYFDGLVPAFKEANRVLKLNGTIIVGCIDKHSPIGQYYESIRQENIFYKQATFYTVDQVSEALRASGFSGLEYTQTLFGNLNEINEFQPAEPGYGDGSFVVIKAFKSV